MRLVIQLLLWVAIVFLGYLVFESIYSTTRFNEIKQERYAKVIENLKDLRIAQLAHKEVTGQFQDDFDDLVAFIDTAEFTLTQRRDTVLLDEEYLKTYGVDNWVEVTVIDTLGFRPVRDSLFGNSNRYKTMIKVPLEHVDAEFEMDAGTINRNGTQIPVFEVRVAKDVILSDQDWALVQQEKQVVSVDDVNGPYLRVGSMDEVVTAGNWPETYGKNE